MKKNITKSTRGQAAVEFVLMLPILLLLSSLAIDVANMISVGHRLSAASREGARIATETTQPIPLEGTCDVQTCTDDATSLCCLAVRRTNLVLWNSGVQNPDAVTGEWTTFDEEGRRYIFLEITATETVNFIFGMADQTLTFRSVSYGDDIEISE